MSSLDNSEKSENGDLGNDEFRAYLPLSPSPRALSLSLRINVILDNNPSYPTTTSADHAGDIRALRMPRYVQHCGFAIDLTIDPIDAFGPIHARPPVLRGTRDASRCSGRRSMKHLDRSRTRDGCIARGGGRKGGSPVRYRRACPRRFRARLRIGRSDKHTRRGIPCIVSGPTCHPHCCGATLHRETTGDTLARTGRPSYPLPRRSAVAVTRPHQTRGRSFSTGAPAVRS